LLCFVNVYVSRNALANEVMTISDKVIGSTHDDDDADADDDNDDDVFLD
jgi:hypothetical protein